MNAALEFEPTQTADALFKEYSELLRNCVLAKAKEIASREVQGHIESPGDQSATKRGIEGMHIARAIQEFEGDRPSPLPPPAPSWSRRILESISGLTLVAMVLALAFGLLGVFASYQALGNRDSYLDIAKLFAGAIVGSTGAAAVAATRR